MKKIYKSLSQIGLVASSLAAQPRIEKLVEPVENPSVFDQISERLVFFNGLDVYSYDDTYSFYSNFLSLIEAGFNTFIIEAVSNVCDGENSCLGFGALKAWASLPSGQKNDLLRRIQEVDGKMVLTCGDFKDNINDINVNTLVDKCMNYIQAYQFNALNLRLNYVGANGYTYVTKIPKIIQNFSQYAKDNYSVPIYIDIDKTYNDYSSSPDPAKFPSVRSQIEKGLEISQSYIDRLLVYYNWKPLSNNNYNDIFGATYTDAMYNDIEFYSSLAYFHENQIMNFTKIIPIKPATSIEPENNSRTYGIYDQGYETFGPDDEFGRAGLISAAGTVANNVSPYQLSGLGVYSYRVTASNADYPTVYPTNLQAVQEIGQLFGSTQVVPQTCEIGNCNICNYDPKICDFCLENFILSEDQKSCDFDDCSGLEHCLTCSDENTCTQCDSEDYEVSVLDDDTKGTCVFVCEVEFCQSCSQANVCEICENWYMLDEKENLCVKEENSTTQSTTPEEETVDPNACEDPNCEVCNSTGFLCVECKSGYILNNDNLTCEAGKCKDPKCQDCSLAFDNCSTCQSGYSQIAGTCYTCAIDNCASCNGDVNSCSRCMADFELRYDEDNEETICSSGELIKFTFSLVVLMSVVNKFIF